MGSLIAYLVAAGVAVAAALAITRRAPKGVRDPSWDLADHARKLVSIAGSLAGFAVTGLVLLVTLGRNLPTTTTHGSLAAVLTMFVVAYLGYVGSGLMFANLTTHREGIAFDLQGAQYTLGAITVWQAIVVGWLALRPLLIAFDQRSVADLVSWLLLVTAIGGWLLVASSLYRTGFAPPLVMAVLPVLALAATATYALVGQLASGIRSTTDVQYFRSWHSHWEWSR